MKSNDIIENSSSLENNINSDTPKISENESKPSECCICGKKFRFLKALQKHETKHQGEGGFICKICGMHFTTSEAREKHRDQDHKVLRCKICNIRFDLESQYLQHINSLHDGRDRELSICSTCGKQFKTKGELTHHVSSKCGTIKKYQCSVCFQTLMTAGSLHNHMLRHSGERTFMCRFCAKTFLTAGQLTVHERIHTQEKAFVCEVCNKGFCHRQSLITHSTLHTGIKPYQCEACGNSFSCVGNLLKHRKTHADTCGKVPLTTHRVKNPATKFKVQVNTPATSKLRTLEKRKKIEDIVKQDNNLAPWEQTTSNSNCSLQSTSVSSETENNVNSVTNNFTTPELNISVESENNFEKLQDKLSEFDCEKQESWISSSNFIKNEQQNFTNIVPCQNNFSFDTSNFNYISPSDKNEDKTQNFKSENINLFDEIDNQNSLFDHNDDCSADFIQNSSDDSLDLNTRKLKLNLSKKEKNIKKAKSKKKSTVDRDKLKKFIEDRGLDNVSGMNCKYCGSHYSVPLWLMKHEQKHEDALKNGNAKSVFKCSCCSQTFENKDECISHQHSEHVSELTCVECERMFANPDSLKAHRNFSHGGVARKRYVYVCAACGRVFRQRALLTAHEQAACGAGPLFPCTDCGKAFSSQHVLRSHRRVHQPHKALLCKFCGKSFHWQGQLKIHERSHTGERPFKCQYCPKAFAYRESLITHSTLHTGIKPHLCEACGSRFSCIGNLLKHRRTHANTCGAMSQVKTEVLIS